MCAVLDLVDNKRRRFSYELCVDCMRLISGKITHVTFCVLTLFTHGVSTFMYFYVAPVSAIPYIGLMVNGFRL